LLQDKPFDFAQDKPFDFAQDKPFDFAQDKPFDFAQDKLRRRAAGRRAWEPGLPEPKILAFQSD